MENKKKWYEDDKGIDILMYLFPPLAFYLIYKSKREIPNLIKAISGCIFFLMGIIAVIAFLVKYL